MLFSSGGCAWARPRDCESGGLLTGVRGWTCWERLPGNGRCLLGRCLGQWQWGWRGRRVLLSGGCSLSAGGRGPGGKDHSRQKALEWQGEVTARPLQDSAV